MRSSIVRVIIFLALFLPISLYAASGGGNFSNEWTDLSLSLTPAEPVVDPSLPFGIHVAVQNVSDGEATSVSFQMSIPGTRYEEVPEFCQVAGSKVSCSLGTLPARSSVEPNAATFWLYPIPAAEVSGLELEGRASVDSVEVDRDSSDNQAVFSAKVFQTYYVVSNADDGDGSLRWAINEANDECGEHPCKIAFMIPSDDSQATIRPTAPLPRITAQYIVLDGAIQTKTVGDTNQMGPEVELNGNLNAESSFGIELVPGCRGSIRGIAVSNFTEGGIYFDGSGAQCSSDLPLWTISIGQGVTDCYLGTDPTGQTSQPNLRGIVIEGGGSVERSIVSGNHLSGIYLVSGPGRFAENIIGLNQTLTAPLSNGASGIYIGPTPRHVAVEHNFIGFNHHFGVAVSSDATDVEVRMNSIQANWQGGIDVGLDGSTPVLDVAATFGTVPLSAPRIVEARWDSSRNTTIVTGLLSSAAVTSYLENYLIQLYANDEPDPTGLGEGQYVLGEIAIDQTGQFSVEIPADLRGKWIAATTTFRRIVGHPFIVRTSEFGEARVVD